MTKQLATSYYDYYRAGGTGSYKAGNPTAGLYANGVARMIYKRIFIRNKHPEDYQNDLQKGDKQWQKTQI